MKKPFTFLKILLIFTLAVLCGTTFFVIFNNVPTEKRLTAYADESGEYLRIITDDTPFYADKTADTPLFYLPYTYYVRVLSRGELFSHVEYGSGGAAIDGFVPTDKLFYDGLTVEKPFPDVKTLTANTAVLYKTAALSNTVQFVFEGRELYLYGKNFSPQGKILYYVGYNDKLGYVKEEDVLPFTVANHPNELTFLPPDPEPEPEPEQPKEETPSDSVFNLRIAIFAVLGLAGVIALILALNKKPKTSPAASYYDENDYE